MRLCIYLIFLPTFIIIVPNVLILFDFLWFYLKHNFSNLGLTICALCKKQCGFVEVNSKARYEVTVCPYLLADITCFCLVIISQSSRSRCSVHEDARNGAAISTNQSVDDGQNSSRQGLKLYNLSVLCNLLGEKDDEICSRSSGRVEKAP